MLMMILIGLFFSTALTIAGFEVLPRRMKRWLTWHTGVFFLLSLCTIPLMLWIFAAGMYGGIMNLGSSFLACLWVRARRASLNMTPRLREGARI